MYNTYTCMCRRKASTLAGSCRLQVGGGSRASEVYRSINNKKNTKKKKKKTDNNNDNNNNNNDNNATNINTNQY